MPITTTDLSSLATSKKTPERQQRPPGVSDAIHLEAARRADLATGIDGWTDAAFAHRCEVREMSARQQISSLNWPDFDGHCAVNPGNSNRRSAERWS